MLYQRKTFTLPSAPKPSKIDGCEACIYGHGAEHTCEKAKKKEKEPADSEEPVDSQTAWRRRWAERRGHRP